MRISRKDRFQAIARHPVFKKNHKEFVKAKKAGNDKKLLLAAANLIKVFDISMEEARVIDKISKGKLDVDKGFVPRLYA